ncbi:phenylacetate-CoA ligase [Herbaspirillum sp. Sphag1AN]|uniref:phenylacetate--CoA ligase family protein n=1 Tax=unclassified Herbaspirillum TaxID=2624150 RepID=UPI0016187A15|nr:MULTISPECIES: AMP-binding protein [unclassified Herbaspirillum]MBB3212118.1 phenylacetate-CoA ligase [Herbaspirillum sp. Sphag1AN]MBB3244048.1 phenylacetate-CoA ligase [Herbaspirillum sp. Sphag64]
MADHLDSLEQRSPELREASLMAALPDLIARAQAASGWASILQGVVPQAIDHRAALAQLPVTRKSDLHTLQAAQLPFGGMTVTPPRALKRLFVSPGPIYDPEGHAPDWWRFERPLRALGLHAGQVIQNCFSYHFTPAAFMVEGAAIKLGCAVIPAGIGQTELQAHTMAALQPDAYIGTPSFLKIIIEKAAELGLATDSLQRALVSGEALPPSLRSWFHGHGVGQVLQLYASADIGSIAYETQTDGAVNPGMVLDESLILEIVRPGTGDPVQPGEVGEVVVTSFNPDYPLIRFATGDMSAVLEGISPCGRTNTRIKGWLGRADQTTKVRGMFVHPSQVADVLRRHPAIRKARLVVTGEMANDSMTLLCETSDPQGVAGQNAAVADSLRDVTKLRGEVCFVALGSLPNDGKVIEDARSYA